MAIETLKAADVEYLKHLLRGSEVLGDGHIRDIVVEGSQARLRSRIFRLRLTYDGANAHAPNFIILKTGFPDRTNGLASPTAAREIAFYNDVAPFMSTRLVPRCFGTGWNVNQTAWHLLLEDLTDSHFVATKVPFPPTMTQCESIMEARAHFHAQWWNDPRLGISVGTWSDTNLYLKNLAEQFALFSDRHREIMPPERHDLYERFLGRAPNLLARYHSRRNLTIIHGDAHVWNCMLPRPGAKTGVRFFDWEVWNIGTATADLAYMMALNWYPDRRHRMEQPLLDCYHRTLMAHGVSGYDRQALEDDYRLSALWLITRPVSQALNDIPAQVWWNNLERIFLAIDDLDCRDLLV